MNTEGVLTRTMRDTAGLLDAITDRGRRRTVAALRRCPVHSPPRSVATPAGSASASA